MTDLKEYTILANGVELTVLLDEETAKRTGATSKPVPANKIIGFTSNKKK